MGRTVSPIRRCSVCKQKKPLESFTFAPSKPGGRTYECLDCAADRQLERAVRRRFSKMHFDEITEELHRFRRILEIKQDVAMEMLINHKGEAW